MHRFSRSFRHAFLILAGATSLGATCVPNPNERPPGEMGPIEPEEVGFAEIEADIKANCSTTVRSCHSTMATTNEFKIGDDRMANFATVKKFITDATPEQSALLLKAIGMGTPEHGGGQALTGGTGSPVYQRWLKWIKDGVVFDPKNKPATYADIEKDMASTGDQGCGTGVKSCHGPTATTNRLKITPDKAANYQLVKGTFVDLANPDQSLLLVKAVGGMMHTGGALLKTTDPVYTRWLSWIKDGAKEK